MRGQHPSISQPLPRQQSGYDDMQLLQQQYMYKQLQELQRQQQIQMGQEQKQQNSFNNISMVSRQPPINQLPTLVNGVPQNDVSSCSWQSEFTGSDPKTSGNSQVALIGNLNLVQHGESPGMCGLMDSHDQGQVVTSMGFVPQQVDQFYSMPISNTVTNQHSQVHGMPQDFSDLMAKANVNQAQRLSIESASINSFLNNQNLYSNQSSLEFGVLSSRQDFQGKKIFGHAAGESVNNAGGNFQQMNTIPRTSEDREINIRHKHSNWSGNLQEKEAQPSGTTEISVGLDPTEQKILFSSDDEFNWDSSFGRSMMGTGSMQGNHLEGTDLFNSFPSIQSGSWSALMQSAVAEVSCGDAGKQDEWNTMTSQKIESTSGNHSGISSDSVKQQTAWLHNSLSHVSPLPPRSALFENGEQPLRTLNFEEKTRTDPQNMKAPWGQQQNMLPYTSSCYPQGKGNSWNSNGPHSANFEASLRDPTEHGFTNDSIKHVHTARGHSVNMWASDVNQVVASSHSMPGLESSKASICFPQMQAAAAMNSNPSKGNYDINQQGLYQHDLAYGKHVFDSSINSQGCENMRNTNKQQKLNRRPQMWESSVSNSDKVSGETNDRTKELGSQRSLSNDSYVSSHSHPDHSSDSVGGARDNFPLSGTHAHSFPSVNQQIHDQIGQDMHAQRFHYNSIGNSVAGNEMKGHHKPVVNAQGLAQKVARGLRSPEQMSLWQTATSGPLDMKLSNAKGMAVMHAECNNNGPDCKLSTSSNEMAVKFPQSSQTGQTGQNMLELLQKVDKSREDDNDATKSSFFDQDTPYCRNETKISEGTINNLNLTHHDTEVQNQKTCFSSVVPVQMYNWDLHKFVPRQVATEPSESNTQADNSMASKERGLSYVRNQLQQQPGGHTASNYPANMPLNTQHDRDIYNMFSSPQLKLVNNDDSIETSQPTLLGISHRIPPFSLASSPETHSAAHSTVVPLTYHVNSQGPQPMLADSSIKRNSNKQLNAADTGQISHASSTSGMSQHSGISGVPHNVWTNISSERCSNSIPENSTPAPMQLMHSGKLDASSWIPRKAAYHDRRNGENIPQNFGRFAQNLPNVNHANEHASKVGSKKKVAPEKIDTNSEITNIAQGKESVPNRASDATPILPNISSVHLHQEKHGKESSDNHHLRVDQSTAMNASPYSLLQQVQAMKAIEVNPDNRGSKRLKETDTGFDSQQLTGKPVKFYGSNMIGKGPTDLRMLSFSSDGLEKQIASKPQVLGKEMSQDLSTSQQPISQNFPHSLVMVPNNFPLGGYNEHQHVQINSQMAPSWFDHYGNSWKSNIPAMFGGVSDNFQNKTRMAAEHFSMPKVSECTSTQSVLERKSDAATVLDDQLASLQELSSGISEHDVSRPKKRKSATSDLLPWHREIMVGSDRIQNIRMAEKDWAQSTNRLVEKVESQAGFSGDGYVMPQTRRRLISTTQLMQQLLPSPPVVMLSKPASTICEGVTYLVAKLSLGDACGLISCLGSDACRHSDGENRSSGKSKASDKSSEQFFLKLMENFVGRARKLEIDLNRLEKRAAILDVKVECQDLEKVAIINRFAKFHGRSQTDGEEGSTCETNRITFAHRYVTPLHMPGNVPEGVVCLSL